MYQTSMTLSLSRLWLTLQRSRQYQPCRPTTIRWSICSDNRVSRPSLGLLRDFIAALTTTSLLNSFHLPREHQFSINKAWNDKFSIYRILLLPIWTNISTLSQRIVENVNSFNTSCKPPAGAADLAPVGKTPAISLRSGCIVDSLIVYIKQLLVDLYQVEED